MKKKQSRFISTAMHSNANNPNSEIDKITEAKLGYWQIKHNNNPNIITVVDSENNSISVTKETLDTIFGTEEEFKKEPKAKMSYKVITLEEVRKNCPFHQQYEKNNKGNK